MTLSDLYRRYLPHARAKLKPKTLAEYERLAQRLVLPKLGARDVTGITLEDVENLHSETPGAVQANRAVWLLSAILTYGVDRKKLAANPCHDFDSWNTEKGKEFFYAPEQTKAILAAAKAFPDIRGRYISLVLLTGCRPNELRDVAPSWRGAGVVRLPDSKTGAGNIYLSPEAEAILDSLNAEHERQGQAEKCYFPAEMDLRRAWERIMREAGVPKARQYDLRHTFASAALAGNVSLDVVGLMLRHKKRETTLKYAHLSPDVGVNAAAAAAARMGAS